MLHFHTTCFDIFQDLEKFCFYVFLLPFRVNSSGLNIEIQPASKVRKVVIYAILFLAAFFSLQSLRQELANLELQTEPKGLYNLVLIVSSTALVFSFIRFSLQPTGLKSLLLISHQHYNGEKLQERKLTKARIIAITISIAHIIAGIVLLFSFLGISALITNPLKYCNKISGTLLFNLFIKSHQTPFTEDSIQPWQIFLVCLYQLMQLSQILIILVAEISVSVSCIAFLQLAADFRKSSNEKFSAGFSDVYNHYREMKTLMNEISGILDFPMLCYLMSAVPYYGLNLIEALSQHSDIFTKIQVMYYLGVYILSLLIAAEGHYQIQQFSQSFYEHFPRIAASSHPLQTSSLSVFLSELTSSNIGLKGLGFLTISYASLASIFGVLITHIIIMIQLQMPHQQQNDFGNFNPFNHTNN